MKIKPSTSRYVLLLLNILLTGYGAHSQADASSNQTTLPTDLSALTVPTVKAHRLESVYYVGSAYTSSDNYITNIRYDSDGRIVEWIHRLDGADIGGYAFKYDEGKLFWVQNTEGKTYYNYKNDKVVSTEFKSSSSDEVSVQRFVYDTNGLLTRVTGRSAFSFSAYGCNVDGEESLPAFDLHYGDDEQLVNVVGTQANFKIDIEFTNGGKWSKVLVTGDCKSLPYTTSISYNNFDQVSTYTENIIGLEVVKKYVYGENGKPVYNKKGKLLIKDTTETTSDGVSQTERSIFQFDDVGSLIEEKRRKNKIILYKIYQYENKQCLPVISPDPLVQQYYSKFRVENVPSTVNQCGYTGGS